MKLSVTRAQRSLLLFLSSAGYVAWFAGLDRPVHAQGVDASPQAVPSFVSRPALPPVAAIVARDPFAASARRSGEPFEASPSPSPGAGRRGQGDDTVPDIATQAGAQPAVLGLVVRATIVGPNPVAYVGNGSAMDIVRVGDTLGDRRIAAIDIHGVALSDGSRLDLPSAAAAPPAVARPHTITLSIDDLRRLIQPAVRAPRPSDSRAASSAPSASVMPTDSGPGPLPTVDPRGLPAGIRPTPDANAATAFPYPYPYPPASR